MAEVGEARVRITADTEQFEAALLRTIFVMHIYALREIALVKMMAQAYEASFDRSVGRVNELISASAEELHAFASQLENELASQPRQEGLPL